MGTILALDDNALDLELLSYCAEEARIRHTLACYQDPKQLLKHVEKSQRGELPVLGCVVVDLRMPEMDGFELARQLQVQAPGLEIVLFTTSQHPDDARLARELGVDLVVKPVQVQGYVRFLRELAERVDRAAARAPEN